MHLLSEQLPLLYVVILNWNNPADTLYCLKHVAQSRYAHMHVVIVDNGSTDDSVEQIHAAFPDYALLQNLENLGYAGGNNTGMWYSLEHGADYIVLLNNDAFVEPDTLSHLVMAAERDSNIAAAGCRVRLYDTPRRLWAAGEVFPDGLYPLDDGFFDTPRDISYASGCCILLRRAVLEQIGLFEPLFFCYFEEKDWCLRASNAGYRIIYVPEAIVYHRVSATAGKQSPLYYYLLVRNFLYMSERYGRIGTHLWRWHDAFLVWLHWFLRVMISSDRARWQRGWAVTRGVIDFLRGRFGPPPERL